MTLQLKSFRLLMLAFFLLVQLVAPVSALAAPELGEDNGFVGNAIEFDKNVEIKSEINSMTGEDWYTFTAPNSGIVELYLQKLSYSNSSMYVYLFDAENTHEYYYKDYESVYENRYWDITSHLKPGKQYYLKFKSAAGDAYSFHMSYPPYGSTNGFRGAAQELPYKSTVAGIIDTQTKMAWYTFTAPPKTGESVQMLVTQGQNSTTSKYFYLYEAESYNSDYPNYLIYESLYSGQKPVDLTKYLKGGKKYFVKVEGVYGAGGGEGFSIYLNGPATTPSKTVASVTLSPANPTLGIGETVQLAAKAVYTDGTQEDVTSKASWNSSNKSVATVTAGKVTAVAEGSTTVSATFGNKSTTTKVEVSSTSEDAVLMTLLANPKKVTVDVGGKATVTLTGVYDDGSEKNVTSLAEWSSDDTSIAVVAKGNIIGKSEGATTVTAELDGESITIPVTVTEEAGEVVLESLEASEDSIVLEPNKSLKLKVYANYSDGTQKDVTTKASYTSTKTSVVTVKVGVVKAGKNSGTATIKIKYEKQTLEIPVEVNGNKVVSLEASDTEMTIGVGETKQVDLIATYSDKKTKDVTTLAKWTTDDSEVAVVNGGEIEGVSAGVAIIKARYLDKEVQITVDVTDEGLEIEGIELSESNLKMLVGDQAELSVYAVYTNGTTKEITDTEEITWKSRSKTIASVDLDGVITANKVGSTTVTASYEGYEASIKVDVAAAKTIKKLVIDPTKTSLVVGEEVQVTLTAQYTDGTEADVTEKAVWTAKLTSVASVTDGLVLAKKVGTTTITAKVGGKTATMTVTVTEE